MMSSVIRWQRRRCLWSNSLLVSWSGSYLSRSLFLSLITYLLIIAGVATVRGEFIELVLPLVIYLLAGLIFVPDKIKLEATRRLSAERVSSNAEVVVTVTIANHGSHLEEVLIEDLVWAT